MESRIVRPITGQSVERPDMELHSVGYCPNCNAWLQPSAHPNGISKKRAEVKENILASVAGNDSKLLWKIEKNFQFSGTFDVRSEYGPAATKLFRFDARDAIVFVWDRGLRMEIPVGIQRLAAEIRNYR